MVKINIKLIVTSKKINGECVQRDTDDSPASIL